MDTTLSAIFINVQLPLQRYFLMILQDFVLPNALMDGLVTFQQENVCKSVLSRHKATQTNQIIYVLNLAQDHYLLTSRLEVA